MRHITSKKIKEIFESPETFIDLDVVNKKIIETQNFIKSEILGKKAAIADSGGKDALLLKLMTENLNIPKITIIYGCDYNFWKKNLYEIQTELHTLVLLDFVTPEWIKKRPQFLFTHNWSFYKKTLWVGLHDFYKKEQLDVLLLGRRDADGNFTGKNFYTINSNKMLCFSPLKKFSHLETIAAIKILGGDIPIWYSTGRGDSTQGNCPFNRESGWKDVKLRDPIFFNELKQIFELSETDL